MGSNNGSVRKAVPGHSLRTIIISRNAYDWQYGGAEQFTLNFAKSMLVKGVQPIVVTRVPELLRQCREERIVAFSNLWLRNETHRRWMPLYYLLMPLLVGQYAYLILRYRADVLLLGSRDDQIFGTMAAVLTRRPVVWVDHADMKGIIAQPFRFLRRSYFWVMKKATRIVAVSEAERQMIYKNLPKKLKSSFVVINNGAKLEPAEAMPRPKDGRVIVFVGRLEQDKGIFDLVKAAKIVLEKSTRCHFWLVGKGSAEDEIRKELKNAGIQEHVSLLGHLDRVGEALLAADIFVYPTHHDASPLAPVEAMQAGLPVIASRVGGIPEVVKDKECGLLVEPGKPEELAEALISLLSDQALYATLKANAIDQGSRLEFDRVVNDRYLPLLEDAAG